VALTQEALDLLLAFLPSDREGAGKTYERVQLKLTKLFEWRGSACPEDLANETIERVSQQIEEGETIRIADPLSYFYAVARDVLREHSSGPATDARS
jgi:DNA-directed RNA polymerase specialized sigma24 family protein